MVHNTLSGESLGATSLRSPVVIAEYFPADNLILVLTGNYSDRSETLNNIEFRAINLEQRSIASQEFSGSLGLNKAIELGLVRDANNTFTLKGTNKTINIRANF
jgi:hypothetical protein